MLVILKKRNGVKITTMKKYLTPEDILKIKLGIFRHFDKRVEMIDGKRIPKVIYRNGEFVYPVCKRVNAKTIQNLSIDEIGRWFENVSKLPKYHKPYGEYPKKAEYIIAVLMLRKHFLHEDNDEEMKRVKAEYVFDVSINGNQNFLPSIETLTDRYVDFIIRNTNKYPHPDTCFFFNHLSTFNLGKYIKGDEIDFVYLTPEVILISTLYSAPAYNYHLKIRNKMFPLLVGLMNEFGIRKKVVICYVQYYKSSNYVEEFTGAEVYEWFNNKLAEIDGIEKGKIFYEKYADYKYE